jgi:hypothetical protein
MVELDLLVGSPLIKVISVLISMLRGHYSSRLVYQLLVHIYHGLIGRCHQRTTICHTWVILLVSIVMSLTRWMTLSPALRASHNWMTTPFFPFVNMRIMSGLEITFSFSVAISRIWWQI